MKQFFRGDLVEYNKRLWFVKKTGTTWIHDHPYVVLNRVVPNPFIDRYDYDKIIGEYSINSIQLRARNIGKFGNKKIVFYGVKK